MDEDTLPDQLRLRETIMLLKMLALYLSPNTKLKVVPRGTKYWRANRLTDDGVEVSYNPNHLSRSTIETVVIPLIEFFGMYVGYNAELDILVYWQT